MPPCARTGIAAIVLLLVWYASDFSSASAAVSLRPVALIGQQAPDVEDGTTFSRILGASINSSGQVAFTAVLNDPFDKGIWSQVEAGHDSLALIARVGDPDPDNADRYYQSLSNISPAFIDEDSQVTFTGTIVGGGSSEGSWVKAVNSELSSLIVAGNSVPQAADGSVIREFAGNNFAHNRFGETAVRVSFNNSGEGGVIFHNGNEQQLVARDGAGLDGLPEGFQIGRIGGISLIESGAMLLQTSLRDTSSSDFYTALLLGKPEGPFDLIVRTDDPVPLRNGAIIAGIGAEPDINASGTVGLSAQLGGPDVNDSNIDAVLTVDADNGIALVARSGEPAPGLPPGSYFDRLLVPGGLIEPPFRLPAFNFHSVTQEGQVIFSARTANADGSTAWGYWIGDAEELQPLVIAGQQVPQMAPGVSFAGFVIGHGQNDSLIVQATLSGTGIDEASDLTLWRVERGNWNLILREGQVADLGQGDLRVIDEFNMRHSFGNDDGRGGSINRLGQLLMDVSFTGGASGLFVIDTIPEPGSLLLASVGGFLLLARRRPYRGGGKVR